jgi:transaldolase
MAADTLRPVYEQTGGADGYATVAISPHLAHDCAGSVAQARWLWTAVDRPNVMVTAPAAREGIAVIETLLAEGINIHATLLFSLEQYEAAAGAFFRGVSRARHPERLASVAAVFVSRLDTAVDRILAARGGPEALDLRGKIALANARMIYRRFREMFFGAGFRELRVRGARVQRLLWASTGTRNPAYSDVRYVEDLIGPDTAAILPPATLEAFREHGRVRGATVTEGVEEARRRLAQLPDLGIDLRAVADRLQCEGVGRFQVRADSAADR